MIIFDGISNFNAPSPTIKFKDEAGNSVSFSITKEVADLLSFHLRRLSSFQEEVKVERGNQEGSD